MQCGIKKKDNKEAGNSRSRMFQVWRERVQVQKVFFLREKKEDVSSRENSAERVQKGITYWDKQ